MGAKRVRSDKQGHWNSFVLTIPKSSGTLASIQAWLFKLGKVRMMIPLTCTTGSAQCVMQKVQCVTSRQHMGLFEISRLECRSHHHADN